MDEKKPFWAKCSDCSHCWPPFYAPIDMKLMAKLSRRPICPMCGAAGKKIVIAKQDDGRLLEEQPA